MALRKAMAEDQWFDPIVLQMDGDAEPDPDPAFAGADSMRLLATAMERVRAAHHAELLGRAGVGVDNVDLEAATRRGVVVMNTPGGSSVTVAELTLAHMLALSRHVAQATASVKAGKWEKKKFQGHELHGKTLGVVGIGNIGSVVVQRCQALGMKVLAYDPFISAEAAAKLRIGGYHRHVLVCVGPECCSAKAGDAILADDS